jgi:predicted enzyme related to lactoylglutathione lyase
MAQFKAVYPISNEDTNALPVKEIGPAVVFYQTVLGFSLISSDSTTAVLKRDEAQIGLIRQEDHKPPEAGSCCFDISDLDALHNELKASGGKPGEFGIDEWGGKQYRTFFLREDDNGYCFCFSQPV